MADFWIVGGLMAGAFVSPLYFLAMRFLNGSQRMMFFALIGALLLAISARLCNGSIAPHDWSLAEVLTRLSLLTLTVGWFVCGLFHALASFGREWVPQRALFPRAKEAAN